VYGIEAINHHNGWAMAIAGALIVLSGLSVLSFIISQLHKVAEVIEKRGATTPSPALPETAPADIVEEGPALNLDALQADMRPLADALGESFELHLLYAAAEENGSPHVHLTIRSLREAGVLVPQGDGVFKWK
jgi:hypothetical protein